MTGEPLYTLDILRLAASLPLESSLHAPDGRAEKRSPTCGSVIAAEVRLDGERVAEVAQRVQACAFGQASAALVQRFAVGRSAAEIKGARERMAAWLGGSGEVPETFEPLAPARSKTGRHGAILLPFDALIAAVGQASDRHSREGGSPAPEMSSRPEGREMDRRLRGDEGK